MSGEAVLIAAFSGRALAQSARRAGYEPLVVDAFGDLDTRAAAADLRVIDGAIETGFRTKRLITALDDLSRSTEKGPIGLVLGSGFEDKPRLVAALASRYRLLGSDAATIAACKDPARFFALLDEHAIAHPATQTSPPDNPKGWISKRIGGSGGRHIRDCRGRQRAQPRRYFQQRLDGVRLSIGGLFADGGGLSGGDSIVALTRQWISPSAEHPYRFGGCVSQPDVDLSLFKALASAVQSVRRALNLVGVASFDFLVSGQIPYLLEVNPRPGASLDVLDEEDGYLFSAHVAAWNGVYISAGARAPRPARASAILHADRGPVTLSDVAWPEWSADRGPPGAFVPRGAPLATAFADASTADAAEALSRARLAELEDLIYGHAKTVATGA